MKKKYNFRIAIFCYIIALYIFDEYNLFYFVLILILIAFINMVIGLYKYLKV
jgi:hypothetical protein